MLWLLLFTVIFFYCIKSILKPPNYPPGPAWLPWIGSALIVNKLNKKYNKDIHASCQELADQYKTDILGLKLGKQKLVVVFNKTSLQVLQNQVFDGRPDNFFIRLRTMGQRKGVTGVDGPFWEEHRQFISKNLRDNGYGKSTMDDFIMEELAEVIGEISKKNVDVHIGTLLSSSILNILWLFLSGKPLGKNNNRISTLVEIMQKRNNAFDMSGGILNQMPWLRFVAPDRTGYTLIKQLNVELYKLFADIITEQKLESDNEDNLINSYLAEINKGGENSTFTDDQLLMVCFDFFVAGSMTTSEYLNLAFLAMLRHPEVQKNVQSEIESVVGQRQISINDRKNTPYCMAVMHEISRCYNIMNIIGPRRSFTDINLNGYVIPKNATVLISTKSLHSSSAFWNEPEVFRPERFLNGNNKLINTDKILTFGLGRRRCLGEALAKNCIYLFFCGILQRYTIEPANGKMPTKKLQYGIISKALPYRVNFIPK